MEPAGKPASELFTLAGGRKIEISGYDCDHATAERFSTCLRAVWERLPDVVRVILDRHWSKTGLSVVLTGPPPSWGRKGGFASAKPDGAGIYCWSGVLEKIPDDYLQIDLAHELGHITFIVIGETHHAKKEYGDAEWLIAALQETRGLDQVATKIWQEENVIVSEETIGWRLEPEAEEERASRVEAYRRGFTATKERREAFRQHAGLYFKLAAGTCSPELVEIAKKDPDRLGRILRGEEAEPT